jgi:hypothetical protein
MGASGAVAVILLKEKHIVAAFRRAGATSPAAAAAPAAIGVDERLAFQKLKRRAVLREARSGLFYLDEPSWEALRRMRRRMALLLGLLVLVAALASLLHR